MILTPQLIPGVCVSLLLLAMGANSASGALISVTTASGSGADAYINTGSATLQDTNAGNATVSTAKYVNTAPYTSQSVNRKGYVRFDITGNSPAAAPNAVLKLYTTGWNGTVTMEVWGLNNGDAGENWIEGDGGTSDSPVGEIDWNNAPANDGTAATSNAFNTSRATLLGTFSQASTVDNTEINFTSANLNNFLSSDTNGLVTLMLLRTTSSTSINSSFFAKEIGAGGTAPTLQFESVPEPSMMSLVGFGALLLGARRRNRAMA